MSIEREENFSMIYTNLFKTKKEKEAFFKKGVQLLDNYTHAVEMGLQDFQNYYYAVSQDYLTEVEEKGLLDEFDEFALTI